MMPRGKGRSLNQLKSIAIAILIQIYPTKSVVVIAAAAFSFLQMAFSTTSPTVFLVTKSTDLSQLHEVMVPTGNITLLVWKFLGPKAESIPWEIDDLFVVDELTASSMPPQNSTRSIRSVASGDLGADDAV